MLFTQDLPITLKDNKILLNIKVTPKASSDKIGKIIEQRLKIYVKALPEDGQANKAVIDLLSSSLKMAKTNISIVNGHKVSNKQVLINGDTNYIIKYLKTILE